MSTSGMEEKAITKVVEDHLKQLVIQYFDPKKADMIFENGAGAPVWLEWMIQDAGWRQVIYELSETYKNCLLLNFAIQKISDQGHQTEIANLTSASTYFGVFNRVLTDSLEKILQLDELALAQVLPDFKKMCGQNEQTYFYTQFLLQRLMAETTKAYNLKRLKQELEYAVLDKGRAVHVMDSLLSNINEYPTVASGIATMITSNSTNPADVLKLYGAYTQPNPPPVEFLRNPLIFDIFIRDLFNPLKTINQTHKSKYFYVLAYAATMDDNKGEELQEQLKATITALEAVQPICQKNPFGSELQASVSVLKQNLVYPVVAMGMLYWIKVNLTDPDYYTTSYNTLCIPIHLGLLRDIAAEHPLHRPHVWELLSTSFEMNTGLEPLAALEMKKNLLDNIINLLQCGFVLPIMSAVERWAPKIDQSLIRYFIVQLLEVTEPPYSYEFLSSLLRITERPTSVEALKSLKQIEKKELIAPLIEHCRNTEYGWDNQQKATLQMLHDIFCP